MIDFSILKDSLKRDENDFLNKEKIFLSNLFATPTNDENVDFDNNLNLFSNNNNLDSQ